MADLEERLLCDKDIKHINNWWRYIDDVFLIWKHLFLEKIKIIQPTIKFMADCSYSWVSFLEVKVSFKGEKIITDLYVKPTDTIEKRYHLQPSSAPQ